MAIGVKCPNSDCGKEYRLQDELAGRKVRCRECGTVIVVPSDADAELAFPRHHPARLTCSNCGVVLGVRDAICPHCGYDVRSGVAVARREAQEKSSARDVLRRLLVPLLVVLAVAVLALGIFALLKLRDVWSTEGAQVQVEEPESSAE